MPLYRYTGGPISTSTGTTIKYVSVASDGTISGPTSYVVEDIGNPPLEEIIVDPIEIMIEPTPVYLVEVSAHNGAEVVTLRYATSGVVVDGYYYEPRVINPGSIRSMLFGEGTTFGESTTGYGEIVLVNSDGALDPLIGYGLSGRTVMIKRLLAGVVTLLAACTGEQATVTTEEVAIRVKDPGSVFSTPVQTNKYGGTNALPDGVDGTDDIKGREKPLVFGTVYNATPVLVNTSRLVYQINDGSITSIPAVYDKGVKLTEGAVYTTQADMEAEQPAAGEYRPWLEGGMFRLGSSPAGQITCDATQGGTSADRTAARVAKRIALRKITTGDMVEQDFTDLDALNPAVVGIYINGNTTYRAALDDVLGSIGGWWSFDADGKLNVGRLDTPVGTPVISLTGSEILSLDRVATNDEGRGVPAYQVNLNYQKNYTVQNAEALAGRANNDWVKNVYRLSDETMTSIAYGNGLFVACGNNGNTYTSPDGKNWTPTPWAGGVAVKGYLAYGAGLFVCIGSYYDYWTSANGKTWTKRTFPLLMVAKEYTGSLTYANGQFILVPSDEMESNGAGQTVVTSPNGITWTIRRSVLPVVSGWGKKAAFGNGAWVVVGSTATAARSIDNGVSWTGVTLPENRYWREVTFGNGLFVAVCDANGAEAPNYATSVDGITWKLRGMTTPDVWYSVQYGSGWFLAMSRGDISAVSQDGINWIQIPSPLGGQYPATAFGDGSFIAIGGMSATYSLSVSADSTRVTFVRDGYRTVDATDAAILAQHPNASVLNFDSLLNQALNAQQEANRLLALYKVRRDYLVVTCPRSALPAQLPAQGKTVKLTYPRFGYDSGKLFTFLGYEQHFDTDEVTLYIWG